MFFGRRKFADLPPPDTKEAEQHHKAVMEALDQIIRSTKTARIKVQNIESMAADLAKAVK